MSAVLFAWLALAPGGPECDLDLAGRVVDASTGEPVSRATVRIDKAETQTGDDGRFVLEGLCPGRNVVEAQRADYDPQRRTANLPASTGLDLSLEPRNVDVLDDVVVVAPAPRALNTSASTTLDDEALEKLRGRSLSDALAGVSGVTVLRAPAGGVGKPIIRGQIGRRNLILYDRVRHESQKWGLEHGPEIDPFAADSITVIKGAGGVRYGPDAIGGVVLIDPPPLPTEPGLTGEVHAIGVSNGYRGTTAARVQGTHKCLRGLAWRAEGNISRGGATITPDYPLDNTGSRVWNAAGTLGYQRRGFSLTGTYRHHDLKAGVFTGVRNDTVAEFEAGLGAGLPSGVDDYLADYEIERAFQAVTHQLALVRGVAPLGRAGVLTATYALQINDRDEFDIVRQSISGPQLELDLRTHTADLTYEPRPLPVGNAALEGTVGATYNHRENTYEGTTPGFLPNYEEDGGGVFALERVVWDRAWLEGGVRYDVLRRDALLDDRTFLPFRAQDRLSEDCEEEGDGGRCDTTFHAPSGSLGVGVRPLEEHPDFVTKLDLSTAVRFPNADERFIKGSAPSFPVFANGLGTLGVERTWGGGLTVSYGTPWLFVEAGGFTNFIDDYIYFRALPQQDDDPEEPNFSDCAPLTCGVQGAFPLFSPTPVDALFYGGEAQGTVQPPKWPVSFDAQASWVRARQLGSGTPLVFIPPDRYELGVTYHWPDLGPTTDGYIGVQGTAVDRQRNADPDADFAPPPPAYALLGAEAGLSLPLGQQVLKFAATGTNLTNTRYRDYTSLVRYFADEPGWEVLARISLEFAIGDP